MCTGASLIADRVLRSVAPATGPGNPVTPQRTPMSDTARVQAYRRVVRTQQRRRPTPWQWIWYAFGGGLPRDLAPWVLADTTARNWWVRHLARAGGPMVPLGAVCLVGAPGPA